ncbi:hypothetical protein [Nocardia sp. CC227C]|uniref:hypothetical protein n=1 Tax=Nocardia sp. CC227C TaxID=3044562 RepID=UPI00278C4754|nr:hypothetical protein [Nocardia sp. CC227C]
MDLGVIEPKVVPTPNLLTVEGITHFRDTYRAKFGDSRVDELTALGRALTEAPARLNEERGVISNIFVEMDNAI